MPRLPVLPFSIRYSQISRQTWCLPLLPPLLSSPMIFRSSVSLLSPSTPDKVVVKTRELLPFPQPSDRVQRSLRCQQQYSSTSTTSLTSDLCHHCLHSSDHPSSSSANQLLLNQLLKTLKQQLLHHQTTHCWKRCW